MQSEVLLKNSKLDFNDPVIKIQPTRIAITQNPLPEES